MRKVIIKKNHDIESIRQAGKYLTELLYLLYDYSKPGVALIEIEHFADQYIKKHHLTGAFKHYQGFPANCCLSLNDCLVHGIPDKTILKDGDLLKIDCGITYKQKIADAAISLIVGGNDKNPAGFHLIKTTKEALDLGIEMIKPNAPVINFSQKVYQHLINHNCSIIKPLTGHGVGNYVHEGPYIYNYPCPQAQHTIFQKNMVIALEPITAEESDDFIPDPRNERNLYTQQGDLGAQREYTVVVTDQGAEILAGVKENLRS